MHSSRLHPTRFGSVYDDSGNPKTTAVHGTKTPGKMLKDRSGLQENVLHRAPMTMNGKAAGKRTLNPVTPHGNSQTLKTDRIFKEPNDDVKKPAATFTAARPLADKTPFPNRIANAAHLTTPPQHSVDTGKIPTFPLFDKSTTNNNPVIHNPPPSATRKPIRSPRFSGFMGRSPRFQTPQNTRLDHWNVSDINLEDLNLNGPSLQDVKLEEEIEEDDYSDPEYAPPTAIIPPYEPDFEMPDYKAFGELVFEMTTIHHYDTLPPTSFEDNYVLEDIPLPSIITELGSGYDPDDDDPVEAFRPKKTPTQTKKPIPVKGSGPATTSAPSKVTPRPKSVASVRVASQRMTETSKSTQVPSQVKAKTDRSKASGTADGNRPSRPYSLRSDTAAQKSSPNNGTTMPLRGTTESKPPTRSSQVSSRTNAKPPPNVPPPRCATAPLTRSRSRLLGLTPEVKTLGKIGSKAVGKAGGKTVGKTTKDDSDENMFHFDSDTEDSWDDDFRFAI